MNSPFVYGKIAADDSFTDRREWIAELSQDFTNLTNTVVISPRRWGKSSLIRKVGSEVTGKDPHIRVCHMDIFNARNEDEFYQKLALSVIKGTSSKIEEVFSTAMQYASALIPTIGAGDPVNRINIEFKIKKPSLSADDVLDMAEKIAKDKKIRIIICIDEFQRVAEYDGSDNFQAKLRSHWQLHEHVAYCLYGSRRHMLMDIFTNPEKPFYKFGKTIFLNKIDPEEWPGFIMERFAQTNKTISKELCRLIVDLVDNNPYYIQQLSEEVWNKTADEADENAVREGFNTILRINSELNMALTQGLTITQQNLLHAIVNGEKELSSERVMNEYGLKNSLTVQRAKKALINKDIIDDFGKTITMEDPIYAYWLKNVYYGQEEINI